MQIFNKDCTTFSGLAKIYYIADSHQETRKTGQLISHILKENAPDKNVLFLNGGDMFKGVYPRELERDCYIRMKKMKPDVEMIMTLGNNDFGFNNENLNFLIDTIKKFASLGIKMVCANIFNSEGCRPEWLKPYAVVERDGDKNFITGFCINNINTAKYGIFAKNQSEVIDEIADAVKRENPDNFIILNHDYMLSSLAVHKEFENRGINTDIILGGHDHSKVDSREDLNIYYPEAFCKNMLRLNFENKNNQKNVKSVDFIETENLKTENIFEKELSEFEIKSGLFEKVAPRVLNLTKKYSVPCQMGTFLADEMKNISQSDVAFFSTGFAMKPLEYKKDGFITNYDLKRVISADNTLDIVELSGEDLFKVFQNALMYYDKKPSNSRFLQCSSNMKFEIGKNSDSDTWFVNQVYIDSQPVEREKKYKCCIDSYIANGGQNNKTLQQSVKTPVVINDVKPTVFDILKEGIIKAPQKYTAGYQYPIFLIDEV